VIGIETVTETEIDLETESAKNIIGHIVIVRGIDHVIEIAEEEVEVMEAAIIAVQLT
jgi:hypothetical protein